MSYKVKLFSGAPDKVEADINKWLEGQDIEVVQISPSVAMSQVPIQSGPLRSLNPSSGLAVGEVEIRTRQLLLITIIYKEMVPA